MTDAKKYWVPVAAVGVVLGVFAVAAMETGGDGKKAPLSASKAAVPAAEHVASAVPAAALVATVPTVAVETIAPLPAGATTIPDEYLLKLSGMVQLANARFHRPDKDRWNQAIPIAQQLLAGPCDCEQRNWLKHFVAMGNDALADAEDEYNADAVIMASLGRNDADAMAISRRAN